MKFILNENKKFILAQQIKFMLNESTGRRLILTEDEDDAIVRNTLKTNIADCLALFPAIEAKLNDLINNKLKLDAKEELIINDIKEITSASEEIKTAFKEATPDGTKVGAGLNKYTAAINKLITDAEAQGITVTNKTDLTNAINDIKALVVGSTVDASNIESAKSKFANMDSPLRILKDLIKATLEKSEAYASLLETCKTLQATITNDKDNFKADAGINPDTLDINVLSSYDQAIKVIKQALTDLNTFSTSGTIDTEKLAEILDRLTEGFEDLENSLSTSGEFADSQAADWGTLYSKCSSEEDFEKFWNGDPKVTDPAIKAGYWEAEWGAKAKAVKEFPNAFISDLKELGWDKITNALVAFLKTPNIFNRLGEEITGDVYVHIHNAVARGWLNKQDLLGKGIFKESNLIFNYKLYTGDTLQIEPYLQQQDRLRKEAPSKAIGPTFKTIPETVLSNIMLVKGNMSDLTKDITATGEDDIRPLAVVRQIMKKLFGDEEEAEKTMTSADIQKIIDKIKTPDEAKRAIAYLVDALMIKYINVLDEVNKTLGGKLYATRDGITKKLSVAEVLNYFKFFQLDASYTKNQIKDLLLGLAEKAGIK